MTTHARLRRFLWAEGESDLIQLSWEITVSGIILTAVIYAALGRFETNEITAVLGFLAVMFVGKVVLGNVRVGRYFWAKLACVAVSGLFGYHLIRQAEKLHPGDSRLRALQLRRIEGLVGGSPAHLVISDADGRITNADETIGELTGHARTELIGRPLSLLMPPGGAGRNRAAYRAAVERLRGAAPGATILMLDGRDEVDLRRKDGSIARITMHSGGIRRLEGGGAAVKIDMFALLTPRPVPEAAARGAGNDLRPGPQGSRGSDRSAP